MLDQYLVDTQRLLNDESGQFFQSATLQSYVNKARRRIAGASGCLRVLPRGMQTIPSQETYPFEAYNSLVQLTPGVREILAVRSVAIGIGLGDGAWKPLWRRVPWTDFQARFRVWNRTFIGTISEPGWYAQYGLGLLGVIYLAPIPSQANTMEWDCSCLPQPLINDDDIEPIPQPWQDVIPYFAAVLALLQQQRLQDAQLMMQLLNTDLPFAASVVNPQMIQTSYGATMRSA